MKRKKIKNKLAFNKITVADLSSQKMNEVKGGIKYIYTALTCQTEIGCTDPEFCEPTADFTCAPSCSSVPETVFWTCQGNC